MSRKSAILNEDINDWEKFDAPTRLIKLRDELMLALDLPLQN